MSQKPEISKAENAAGAGDDAVIAPALRLRNALKINFWLLVIVLLIGVLVWGTVAAIIRQPDYGNVYQSEFPVMGTVANVSVYSSEADLQTANEICQREFAAVAAVCSLYDPDSELSRLNAMAASEPFVCSEMMWELLMFARQAHSDSDGLFDITVKPLMDLWGFYRRRGVPPTDYEISNTMQCVGFDKLEFNENARTIRFTVPGMALDLGGIAKGYAVDRAARAIQAAGITAGVVNLGGNLRMLPDPPPGRPHYQVAIRDPHRAGEVLEEQLTVPAGRAVSSSGDYERFVVYNGQRYSHIISPKTGRPTTVSAVTVVADSAVLADIFSTSCCLGGEAAAEKIRAEYPGIEIYFTR